MRIINKVIILISICGILFSPNILAQNTKKNGWYYEKEVKGFFGSEYSVYTLKYYENNLLIQKQMFETDFNSDNLGSGNFYHANNSVNEVEYIWSPYNNKIYLSHLNFNPEDIDSSYTFHLDGMSIKIIRYYFADHTEEKKYKLGERYMFEFPSPSPDTIPAFFEKVKAGCPYTPCTVSSGSK